MIFFSSLQMIVTYGWSINLNLNRWAYFYTIFRCCWIFVHSLHPHSWLHGQMKNQINSQAKKKRNISAKRRRNVNEWWLHMKTMQTLKKHKLNSSTHEFVWKKKSVWMKMMKKKQKIFIQYKVRICYRWFLMDFMCVTHESADHAFSLVIHFSYRTVGCLRSCKLCLLNTCHTQCTYETWIYGKSFDHDEILTHRPKTTTKKNEKSKNVEKNQELRCAMILQKMS